MIRICILMVVFAVPALASTKINERSFSNQKSWMLPSYLSLAESQPAKLIEMSKEQFSKETLDRAKKERGLSYAWQDRMALLGGLSQLFNPEAKIKASRIQVREFQNAAQKLIEQTLRSDTSLLVRDGAVETIRRIIRMQPSNSKRWRRSLEAAFLDRGNVMDGEGLFIRETLLTAIREANLPLSNRIKRAAELDQNPKVKRLLSLWNTRAFDTL
ncbi:hypothetical protein GW916_00545 [bacterium]|nr:hypothetical protein [bacterium]